MSFTIRQICLVAEKLQLVVDDFKHILDIEVCHVDPNVSIFGLENCLLPIGTNFMEIVAPIQENTTAGRYLERRGGDGGYMILLQADSADGQASGLARAKEMGIRTAFEETIETYHFAQLHPGDTGGTFLQIDWDSENEHQGLWVNAGGTDWKRFIRTDVVTDITAAEVQSPDPKSLARRWSEILDVPLRKDTDGNEEMPLNNGVIRFVQAVDGRGEGLGGVDIEVADRTRLLESAEARGRKVSDSQVVICGTRFRLGSLSRMG
ncbi:MAG: hypothetical protein GY866_16460 [Proteobacteria bacterium]|nr:hypothetical protein [Pseudomonadota bacterium]